MLISTTSAFSFSLSLPNSFKFIEKLRVITHLRLTENFLRLQKVDHLTLEQQKNRLNSLDLLHKYWSKGSFPTNTEFSKSYEPYFIDGIGIPCAMAYILQQSGYKSLVSSVNKTNNNVYINSLRNGPVLEAIKKLGLTQKEAAQIQPTYAPDPQQVTLSWAIAGITFIFVEAFIYFAARWITAPNIIKRIVGLLVVTLLSLLITFIAVSILGARLF